MISPGSQGPVPRHQDRSYHQRRSENRRHFFPRVDGDFQWRYSFALALAVGVTIAVFLGPFLYFLNQNFEIFRTLAVDHQPNLLSHIEREVQWITVVAGVSLVAAVLFALAFGYKLTGSIMGPLFSIERHLKKVAAGNWSGVDFRVRATDEFKRLSTAYAHFYRSVRTEMTEDLETLKRLRALTHSKQHADELRFTLSKLIEAKETRLGIAPAEVEKNVVTFTAEEGVKTVSGPSAGSDGSPTKRRAS